MSAEKEIVNYWYNKNGFFTINNIKTSNNRDCGILALKLDSGKGNDVFHIEVSCSITNNIAETKDLSKSISKIVAEKFEDKSIIDAAEKYTKQFSLPKQNIIRVIVLGSFPKSRKSEIIKEFNHKEVKVLEFENIIYDVLEKLDTQYYKNDIIRTLQLTKYLLLSEPAKLAQLIGNDSFSSSSRKEFLTSILDKKEIIKDFKKTNVQRLGAILKNSGLKANELAKMIQNDILNKRTRKVFFDSLTEQENTRKSISKIVRKKETELQKFF